MTGLLVERAGALLTSQDLGRRGVSHWGVARSGAADRTSFLAANRLVGNDDSAAALEAVVGTGTVLRALQDTVVAVTGARCDVHVDGRLEGRNVALRVGAGQLLTLGPTTAGLRTYVAVRGGLDLPAVLGSRSFDQLGALGPRPLTAGDLVPVGAALGASPCWEQVPLPDPATVAQLRVTAGPRADWTEQSLDGTTWMVTPDLDRTGVRLRGTPLRRCDGELPSEGQVPGAVQLPPDGQPILLGPDAGVTGGYPVIAVVIDADLDQIGQLAPNMTLRFRGLG